jgi:2-oxoisovalerate dehydrogenase E1 component alpha subunit
VVALLAVLDRAVKLAREGSGPLLVEANTYRMQAHTNADDATRYRQQDEVAHWAQRDPLARLETYLTAAGLLTPEVVEEAAAAAEALAADMRERLGEEPEVDHRDLFAHVYAEMTPQLAEQAAALQAELDAEAEADAASNSEAAR